MLDASDAASATLFRTIPGGVAEVYAAWLSPDLLRRWLAPEPYLARRVEVDPRVGGAYRIEHVGSDGSLHVTTGEFRELVANRRIAMTWSYQGPFTELGGQETLVEVDFREAGSGRTEITLHHSRVSGEQALDGFTAGWTACLGKLVGLFAGSTAGS